MENKKVVISGGTGLIGSELCNKLKQNGYQVIVLTRSDKKGSEDIAYSKWDPAKGEIYDDVINSAHAVVNLAGASVAGSRWTQSYKQEILQSRIDATQTLVNSVNRVENKPKHFISASAIGIYGDRGNEELIESSGHGDDFLAEVCKKWEEEAHKSSIKTSIVRIGVVLSLKGGALKEIQKPVKLGFGAPLGNGKQFFSWIHIQDLVAIFQKLVEGELKSDVYNATAPNPVTNKTLTEEVANQLNKPLWLPNVPAFALKTLLGEMSDQVLNSQRVYPSKLKEKDFNFKYSEIDDALGALYR